MAAFFYYVNFIGLLVKWKVQHGGLISLYSLRNLNMNKIYRFIENSSKMTFPEKKRQFV